MRRIPFAISNAHQEMHEKKRVAKEEIKLERKQKKSSIDEKTQPTMKYGFAIMFPTVVPFAPLLVFIDFIVTIPMDAALLCKCLCRPVPRHVVDREMWEGILGFASIIGMLVNISHPIYGQKLYYDMWHYGERDAAKCCV
ncbi:hypothetical protein ILUMI_11071 [Ignelater luminosus]|uniref:Anoctamin n=1 Tax=Ignelater luminosus TaxID=2038154 RepID=A0A8K0CWR0_IGNLU|nr:hypothetical protein ILUMI_11071 [Ignelater luminosus]